MAFDVLKTYLVKIQHQVDKESQKKAFAEVDSTKGKVANALSFIASGSVKASAIMASAFLSVLGIVVKITDEINEADVAAERFARRMWTTEENARAMLNALDAVDSSFEDIYNMTPEEFQRLMDLRNFGLSLQAPKEAQSTLVLIRDIAHEFDKLQVLIDYAGQWFIYYFGKHASSQLVGVKENLKDINKFLEDNMSKAMDKLASILSHILRIGGNVITILIKVKDVVVDLFDSMDDGSKLAGAGLLGLFAIIKSGPIGWFIAALTAILLLLDDFMVYKQGGNSFFGSNWDKISDIGGKFSEPFEKTKNILADILDLFSEILKLILNVNTETEAWSKVFDAIAFILDKFADALNYFLISVEALVEFFDSLLHLDFVGAGDALNKFFWSLLSKDYEKPEKPKPRGSGGFGNIAGVLNPQYANELAASGSFGMAGTTNNNTFSQVNNINVKQAEGSSAFSTGRMIASKIPIMRDLNSSLK